MSFEIISSGVASKGSRSLDFSRRAHLSELMDEPCTHEDMRSCLRDLALVNRVTLAYRPTLRWLEQFARLASREHPLHILDVGCGGGDMLRRIEQWALDKRIFVRLTGIDANPDAIRAARDFTPAESRIEWITGEAGFFGVTDAPVSLIISSLVAHHLDDEAILRFLAWMERVARYGWFINDLYRSRVSYTGFSIMAAIARWHRFVRHDGPVSIRRAFLPEEWEQYVKASGLVLTSVQIEKHWPARLCVARVKRS